MPTVNEWYHRREHGIPNWMMLERLRNIYCNKWVKMTCYNNPYRYSVPEWVFITQIWVDEICRLSSGVVQMMADRIKKLRPLQQPPRHNDAVLVFHDKHRMCFDKKEDQLDYWTGTVTGLNLATHDMPAVEADENMLALLSLHMLNKE